MYWREVPPLAVMVAGYLGYEYKPKNKMTPNNSQHQVQPPPLPDMSKPQAPAGRINQETVRELFSMFPNGKITIN